MVATFGIIPSTSELELWPRGIEHELFAEIVDLVLFTPVRSSLVLFTLVFESGGQEQTGVNRTSAFAPRE